MAHAQATLDGSYVLRALPGEYWTRIRLGGEEAHLERYELKPGSWQRDFQTSFVKPAAPALVASSPADGSSESGTGGSGAAGTDPDFVVPQEVKLLPPDLPSRYFNLPPLELEEWWKTGGPTEGAKPEE